MRRMTSLRGVLLAVAAAGMTSVCGGGRVPVGYSEVGGASWESVRIAAMPRGKPQLSQHIPIGLPEASELTYCDGAFNVWRLPVPPNMKTDDEQTAEVLRSLRIGLVSVALGEAPFIPEFRQTRWTRHPGGLPVVRGELDAQYRNYVFEYCSDPADGELYIRCTVKNTGASPGCGVVRLKRSKPVERDVCDYHYATYRWDAGKWLSCEPVEPPRVIESDFESALLEETWEVDEKSYKIPNNFCGAPYFVHPAMRLPRGRGCLRFMARLQPGESRSFTVAAGFVGGKSARNRDFERVCAAARDFWAGKLTVHANFGGNYENEMFQNLQFCNLQLLLNPWQDPSSPCLQPCQGGSSERFYVWVWESMCSLRPMVRLGHFDPVRKVLEFILRLQDGGCPPEGEFTTLSGAIGTTGPRWANTTGAALLLAAEYLECSGDDDFRARHLGDLIRAAKWILGEVKATRRCRGDGTYETGYGLMPHCVVNDGDRGIYFASTDSWSYAGAKRLSDFLLRIGHPDGVWMSKECALYKHDIDRTVASIQRSDGFIPGMIGDGNRRSFEFRNIPSAFAMIASETIDPAADERMARMVEYWERTSSCGPFLNPFDASIRYVGNVEAAIARYHRLRGEWKQAYFARMAFMNYAMTRDLGVTVERYSEVDDAFAPWQPNASNNGRGLDLMIGRFVDECESHIVLMGGFAPFEVANASLCGLYTRFGRCSIRLEGGFLRAEWERPLHVGTTIVVPEYLGFIPDFGLVRSDGSRWVASEPLRTVSGRVSMSAK